MDIRSPDRPVVGVNLKHVREVDASLERLKKLTEVERLSLRDTKVTDDCIIYIKGLTNLEVLELSKTLEGLI